MTSEDTNGLNFMQSISSDGKVYNVTDFASLESLEEALVDQVACDRPGSPTDSPTRRPTRSPNTLINESCLCGDCVPCDENLETCNDQCVFDGTGAPPTSITLQLLPDSVYVNDESFLVDFQGGCTDVVYPDSLGRLYIEKPEWCSGGNRKLNPDIVLKTSAGATIESIHTSCSQPLFVGQIFSFTTLVGYCIEPTNGNEICGGIQSNTGLIQCTIPESSTQPSSSPSLKQAFLETPVPTNSPIIRPSLAPSEGPSIAPSTSLQPSRKAVRFSERPSIAASSRPSSCTEIAQQFECVPLIDDSANGYSLITKDDTANAAKNVYKKMFVGGTLSNPSSSTVTINGRVHYGEMLEPIMTNFNGGKTQLNPLDTYPVDFEYYEWLATHILPGQYSNGREVIVVEEPKIGCYNMYDFLGSAAQGENNGKTLIVFTFSEDLCLTKTHDGRQFGPSVLAPFSKVTLTNSGYADGIIIAREFTTVNGGSTGSEQQLHGDTYDG